MDMFCKPYGSLQRPEPLLHCPNPPCPNSCHPNSGINEVLNKISSKSFAIPFKLLTIQNTGPKVIHVGQ
jgi:hypothetical protein